MSLKFLFLAALLPSSAFAGGNIMNGPKSCAQAVIDGGEAFPGESDRLCNDVTSDNAKVRARTLKELEDRGISMESNFGL